MRIFAMIALSCVLIVFGSHIGMAQTSTKVVVVDVKSLLRESKAAQNIQVQIESYRQQFQKEVAAQEKELRTAEEKLSADKASLSVEQFREQRKVFEMKVIDAQKLAQQRRSALDEAFEMALEELRTQIANIVARVAKDHAAELVLSRQNVFLAEKSLDITKDVLAILDKEVAAIKVTVPKTVSGR